MAYEDLPTELLQAWLDRWIQSPVRGSRSAIAALRRELNKRGVLPREPRVRKRKPTKEDGQPTVFDVLEKKKPL